MRIVPRTFVLLAMLAAVFTFPSTFVFSAQAQSSSSLQVKTASGVVEGKEMGPVHAFLGIPYAAAPVGDLRWKPPVPAAKWDGVRKATEFGSHCMQTNVYGDMVFPDAGGSEDCLSLNVWVPTKAQGKLPVMVWIYGGGFVAGGTSEPRQHGEVLAQQGVIVVSMNYRLGMFGFFVHPELAKESEHHAAGNYGLLDQTAALRWVHENIAAFGGDPANVTIFGESAGSFSVSAQMASPLAKGLFQKAIGESGAAFSSHGLSFAPLAEREQKDAQLASSTLGVSTLAELRAIPAQKLLDAFSKPGGPGAFSFGPDVDGYFLPESVPATYAAAKQNDVVLLAGWNHEEEGLHPFPPDKSAMDTLKATADKEFGARAAEFLKLYSGETEEQAQRSMADFASDRFIAWGTWKWLEAEVKTGRQPVYRYRFDLSLPSDEKGQPRGAYHSAEIEYVFGQLDSKTDVTWRPEDRALSAIMQKYWTNFARRGDPNGPGLPNWPVYSPADGWPLMHLSAAPEAQKDELRGRYLFLSVGEK
jgi:para-nitrobenzyl esterase